MDDYESKLTRAFEEYKGETPGATFQEFEPLFDFGYRMAHDPKYGGRTFRAVESKLKAECLRDHPGKEWAWLEDAVLFGWEAAGADVGGFALI